MDVGQLLALLKDASITTLCLGILWGGYKRIWVWGWQLEASEKRYEALWQLTSRAVDVADRSTPPLPPPPREHGT